MSSSDWTLNMPTGVDGETPPSFLFLDKKISGEPELLEVGCTNSPFLV
jgi:hypothetical protein